MTALTPCPSCGLEPVAGARFCEACGTALDAAAPVSAAPPARATCAVCHGTIADDGYCELCGTPAAMPLNERDHWAEQPAPDVAGVCDRGIRHRRNEDAMAIWAGEQTTGEETSGVAVLVVCDGVSSSRDSDTASLAAAGAARDVLVAEVSDGLPFEAWQLRFGAAADAAQVAASSTVVTEDGPATTIGADGYVSSNAPSCTFVVGVRDGRRLFVGGVGDSRAYWLPDVPGAASPPAQLSRDDSWAAEQIALGMPVEEAENAPRGHAITRWLGADSPGHDPRTQQVQIADGVAGWLMVCSDGLWNYCSPATDLQALVADLSVDLPAPVDPVVLAGRLVDWANAQGGRDNITVTLARVSA